MGNRRVKTGGDKVAVGQDEKGQGGGRGGCDDEEEREEHASGRGKRLHANGGTRMLGDGPHVPAVNRCDE